MPNCCPTCGRKLPTAKPAKATTPILSDADVDTSTMDLKTLFAHYRATAPLEDVRFMLRHLNGYSLELRAGFEVLELAILHTNPTRKAIYQEYGRLQDRWRAESNARDRAERLRHAADCPARSLYNAPCECGRVVDDPPAVVERDSAIEQILAAYRPPTVRLLCA